jgi:2'-5' RNA ligase
VRLFVALRPPPSAIAHLQVQRPRWPIAPERWHLTLAFLGEVDDVAAVDQQLASRLEGFPSFSLRLRGCGTFRGGPVWVGVAGDVPVLERLAATVGSAARAAGVALERRPYRPHLTVGRRGHPDPRSLASYEGPQWRAQEVELVRSDLGRTVTHTVLERYPLGG